MSTNQKGAREKKDAKSRVPIEKLVLSGVGIVGAIALVAVAPGIGPAFKLFGIRSRNYSDEYVRQAVYRLKRKGMLTTYSKGGKRYVRLTKKGKKELAHIRRRNISQLQTHAWDGKWRVVTFDIGEYRRATRDKVRMEMQRQGFLQLQRSVWITPYECEEFVKLLKADAHIGNAVRYMRVEYLENDAEFRKVFSVSRTSKTKKYM